MHRETVGSPMKKSQVRFSKSALNKVLMDNLVPEQTRRLVAYAKDTIQKIGNTIQSYHSRNHMDRTGNLLNSLCWGVSYRGKLEEYGFYREANSLENSYLHEWSGYPEPVWGHAMAQDYIDKYGNQNTSGWRVFFAILAPYWGYWEKGFNFKGGGGDSKSPRHTKFLRFAVMTQFYDTVERDLKPTHIYFKVTKTDEIYSEKSLRRRYESGSMRKWQTKYDRKRK